MIPWDKLHGAMTHFPIALLLFSTACDLVSVAFKKLPFARGLRLVSFYGLAVAALVSVGAVVSGIALTKGDMWGRGDFGWHHRFVWPAFGLLVALAVWRIYRKRRDVADWTMPVSDLDVTGIRFCCGGRVFWGRTTPEWRECAVIMTPLEIKGAAAGVITSVLVLAATFTGGAAGFVLVHNHPCGDPRPSPADIELTERILKGARILALTFLDHVIVGRKIGQQPGYFSFQEAGLL